jgi:hypothetical protein
MKDRILTRLDLTSPIIVKRRLCCSIKQNHARILGQPTRRRQRQVTWIGRSHHNLIIVLLTYAPRQIPTLAPTDPKPMILCIQHINGIHRRKTRHQKRFVYIVTHTTVTVIAKVQLISPRLGRKLGIVSARGNNSSHSDPRLYIII